MGVYSALWPLMPSCVNTLRPRQHGHHFQDDFFKCIFVKESVWISIKFSLNIVPDGPIDNIPSLVQIMAWCRLGDKPLSEPMMVLLLTHICVTRPQWVKAPGHQYPQCWPNIHCNGAFADKNIFGTFIMIDIRKYYQTYKKKSPSCLRVKIFK